MENLEKQSYKICIDNFINGKSIHKFMVRKEQNINIVNDCILSNSKKSIIIFGDKKYNLYLCNKDVKITTIPSKIDGVFGDNIMFNVKRISDSYSISYLNDEETCSFVIKMILKNNI